MFQFLSKFKEGFSRHREVYPKIYMETQEHQTTRKSLQNNNKVGENTPSYNKAPPLSYNDQQWGIDGERDIDQWKRVKKQKQAHINIAN